MADLLAALLVLASLFGFAQALESTDRLAIKHAIGFLVISLFIFYLTVR